MNPTLILLILNVAASVYAWNNPEIYRKWIMNPYTVQRNNQYYRFITSGFIHADWMHLLFNMLSLYIFGMSLERYLYWLSGEHYQYYYYGIYLVALIVSEIPSFLKHKNNSYYNSLGASGAVSAIIFAGIICNPMERFYYIIPGFVFAIGYLIYSYNLSKKNVDGINHDAHFYGAAIGAIAMIVLFPELLPAFFEKISSWNLFN